MTQKEVERFLLDVMGYGKIAEFVEGKKPKDVGLRKFLDGTIFATHGHKTIEDHPIIRSPIPGIYRLDDPRNRKDEDDGLWVLGSENGIFIKEELVELGLPYIIGTVAYFRKCSAGIKRYIEDTVLDVFPNADYTWGPREGDWRKGFSATLKQDDFYLQLEGCHYASAGKLMKILFDGDAETIGGISNLVSTYYWMFRQDEEPKKEVIIDPDLMIDKVTKGLPCDSIPYDLHASYQVGQVLDHTKFGKGVVIREGGSTISVNFPGIGEEKELAQNYKD